jgi:hypothetical protein
MTDIPRTRDQYYDYISYLKRRKGNELYNRGLGFKKYASTLTIPAEIDTAYSAALKCFDLAIKDNPKDPDFVLQFQEVVWLVPEPTRKLYCKE